MREEENWRILLKEEVQEVSCSEELKEQVLHRVTTSWWDREITVPVLWVGGIIVLSLIIVLSPLYGGMSILNHMNVSSKPPVSDDQDFVSIDGMYVERSLLVWGDQP